MSAATPQPIEPTPAFPAALEAIYLEHRGMVMAICLSMTGNHALAEDLAQDVFIRVAGKLDSFRGESAFTTWLHRLTVNQVLMHFRKQSTKRELLTLTGTIPDAVDPDTINPEAMAIVDRIGLETAIAQLPRGYRTVFILHDVEGYEHEEIARILGRSSGTSKSQLHKARMKLRRLLCARAKGLATASAQAEICENPLCESLPLMEKLKN